MHRIEVTLLVVNSEKSPHDGHVPELPMAVAHAQPLCRAVQSVAHCCRKRQGNRVIAIMKTSLILTVLFFATIVSAQGKPDETAIRNILQEEVTAWNKGDAQLYSQRFAADGTFTNILGMFFTGHQSFLDRHDEIFKGMFRGTVLRQEVVSLRFVRPEAAVVETLTWISGFSAWGPPPGLHLDVKGRLRTRLLQVMLKEAGEWEDHRLSQCGHKARSDFTGTAMNGLA